MYTTNPEIGNVRETFFMNQLANFYTIENSLDNKGVFSAPKGNFYLEQKYLYEVGGKIKPLRRYKR